MNAPLPNPSPTDDGGGPEPVLPERLTRDLAGAMRSTAGTTLPAAARAALMAEARARAAAGGAPSRWRIGPIPARWVGGLAAAAAVAVVAWVGLTTTGPTTPSGTASPGQGQQYAGLPPGGRGEGGSKPAGEGGPRLASGRLVSADGDGKGAVPVTFGVPEGQRGPDVVDVLAVARAAAGGAEAADAAPAMLRRLVSLDNFVAAGLGADGVARALAQAGAVGAGGGAAVLGATVSARAGAVLWAGIGQGADTCGTTA